MMGRYRNVIQQLRHQRKELGEYVVCSKKPRIGSDIFSLRIRYPLYVFLGAIWLARIKDAECDGGKICARRGTWSWTLELRGWDFDVYGADFVGPCVLREGGRGV